jgi:hypothetical protein
MARVPDTEPDKESKDGGQRREEEGPMMFIGYWLVMIVWKEGCHEAEKARISSPVIERMRASDWWTSVPNKCKILSSPRDQLPAALRNKNPMEEPRTVRPTRDSGVYRDRKEGRVRKEMKPTKMEQAPTTSGPNSQITKKYCTMIRRRVLNEEWTKRFPAQSRG